MVPDTSDPGHCGLDRTVSLVVDHDAVSDRLQPLPSPPSMTFSCCFRSCASPAPLHHQRTAMFRIYRPEDERRHEVEDERFGVFDSRVPRERYPGRISPRFTGLSLAVGDRPEVILVRTPSIPLVTPSIGPNASVNTPVPKPTPNGYRASLRVVSARPPGGVCGWSGVRRRGRRRYPPRCSPVATRRTRCDRPPGVLHAVGRSTCR